VEVEASSLAFELTPEEAQRARRGLAANLSPLPGSSFLRALFIPAAVGMVIDFASSGRASGIIPFHMPFWSIGVVVGAVLASGLLVIAPLSASRAQISTTVHLSETGFTVHRRGRLMNTTWESLDRIGETPEFFFLYPSDVTAVVLPKRTLGTKAIEQLRAVRQAREQVTARAFALWGRRFPW
jgi:hypothetical protein